MISLDEAISRYGKITDWAWPYETQYCSVLKIPPDIAENWLHMPTGAPTLHIYCNKDIQDPLLKALQNIRDRALLHELHTFDGAFCLRDVRGEPGKLSAHAYGLALDINAKTNALNETGDMPPQLVECFTSVGFAWGGNFTRKDPMHFTWGW